MIDYSLRIVLFLLFVTALFYWQWRKPHRTLPRRHKRWSHNAGLLLIDALLVRLLQPAILIGVALLPSFAYAPLTILPEPIAFGLAIVLLDCLVYWQHRLFHSLPWLWRLHRVHHSDPELDTSSAVRFHPFEIALSLMIKASAIWFLGIPALAVLVFDILLNACALFNHTNAQLPKKLEHACRAVLVTPAMHRIHHSRDTNEANRNFGFCLSIWDHIFKSYLEHNRGGESALNIGLPGTKKYAPSSFKSLLFMPFAFNVKENDPSS